MKYIIFLFSVLELLSCNQHPIKTEALQNQIDSLKSKLADTYSPGFGEFMSNIQTHHAKLWFAGQNNNWKLADFEVHEIMEAVDDIQKYQTERKESQMIGIINPSLDSVKIAIEQKNHKLFKSSYTLLTKTCNNCHHEANFEFIVIKTPDMQVFSNQLFKSQE